MEPKRFYRSTTDKKIAGVAAGLAEYFMIDPMLIRLLFVVVALAGGGGVLIYIILWIVTPEKPRDPFQTAQKPFEEQPPVNDVNQNPTMEENASKPAPRRRGNLIGALVLITLGVLFLMDEFIPHLDFGDLWPILLIVIGIGLLVNSIGRRQS